MTTRRAAGLSAPTPTLIRPEGPARALIVTEMSPFVMAAGYQDDYAEDSDSDTRTNRDAQAKTKEKNIYIPNQHKTTTTRHRLPAPYNQNAIRSKKWPPVARWPGIRCSVDRVQIKRN